MKLTKLLVLLATGALLAGCGRGIRLKTDYITLDIDHSGYVTSIKDRATGKEYSPREKKSVLMSLEKDGQYTYPSSARQSKNGSSIILEFPNGGTADIGISQHGDYVKFELLGLEPRNDIDNIVWGPYNTTISKWIGDIICVVRDDDYAIGIMGLNDNTTSGPPVDGDMYQMQYYVHSLDPETQPIPDSLHEGQLFYIGGDGVNDAAFYDKTDYYRMVTGDGATIEPEFGSSIVMHSRDRRKPHTIFYTLIPGFTKVNVPKHHIVDPVDADFMGSAIAFYGCPDSVAIDVLEKIVVSEKLPHPKIDGVWAKNPKAFRPSAWWYGPQDSLVTYLRRMDFRNVRDEGQGEYYINPANRYGGIMVNLDGERQPIPELTKETNKHKIAYGLHTLCGFTQPHSSLVSPEPNDSLCHVMRTVITNDIQPGDTIIHVADTLYLNEFGVWHDNYTNVLKIGKELMSVDELAVMDGGSCILQLRGVRPFISKKYDITRHPLYKMLSDYDKRNAFNIEKYLSTRLKVRPNDVFEVYEINLEEPPPPAAFAV